MATRMTEALTIYRRSELEGADCLHRYRAIWIDGVDDSSDYAMRGQAFAAIKHRYLQKLVALGLSADDEESQAAFTEGIAESRCPDRLIPEVRELWDRHAEHFELRLDLFVAAEQKQLPVVCLACRKDWYVADIRVTKNACPSCGSAKLEMRPFSFTPDLVLAHPESNTLEIIDDKTFFIALTEAQAQASFQGRFYTRYGMARWPGFANYRFTFNFVRLGKQVSVDYTPTDLAKLEREVEASVAKIEQARVDDYWPATAGPSCTYCELKCPLADNPAIVPKRFTLPEQAAIVANWVLAASRQVSVAKKTLKAYAAANGGINVRGVVFDNWPVLERKYPIKAVLETLRDRNLMGAFDGEEFTLSHSALSKLFKQFPQLEQDLLPYLQSKTTYRFSAKKPGAGDDDDD